MELFSKDLDVILQEELVSVRGSFTINRYSLDSRTLSKGDMFICLSGNTEGHLYIKDALDKGASALMVNENFASNNPINCTNIIIVKDTLKALQLMAKYNSLIFRNSGGKIIGITGSVGKTTLKDMLTFALSCNNKVSSTFANFNNHIGLPFSLMHIESTSKYGIYEMGMSAKGEIAELTKILCPNIAVITDVSHAHSEYFENYGVDPLLNIAEAKLEILEGMDKNSIVFLNKDNSYYDFMCKRAVNNKIISFAQQDSTADVYVVSSTLEQNEDIYFFRVEVIIFKVRYTFRINSVAKHNFMLGALTLAICSYLKEDVANIASNFDKFMLPVGRGKISKIKFRNKEFVLLDDSYNASPKSMGSALLSLKNMEGEKVLILGDMLELGEKELMYHSALAPLLIDLWKNNNLRRLLLVGERMKTLFRELKDSLSVDHFNNYKDLQDDNLYDILQERDILFIKGSFGSEVHKVAKYLQK